VNKQASMHACMCKRAVVVQVLHRLDMDTSGVLLFAKDARAVAPMHEHFRARRIRKEYLALCLGVPEPSAADVPLVRVSHTGDGHMHVSARIARHAEIGAAACVHAQGKDAHTVMQVLAHRADCDWAGAMPGEACGLAALPGPAHEAEGWRGASLIHCQPLTGALPALAASAACMTACSCSLCSMHDSLLLQHLQHASPC
jgi:RNA pseudouridylate synthase